MSIAKMAVITNSRVVNKTSPGPKLEALKKAMMSGSRKAAAIAVMTTTCHQVSYLERRKEIRVIRGVIGQVFIGV